MSTKKQIRLGKGAVETKKDSMESETKPSFSPSGARLFFQEVTAEFRKIAWPGKKVTAGLTGFVLLLVAVISMYLGSVDLLLGKLISTVLN